MTYEVYEFLVVGSATFFALALVRFRTRQRRRAIELKCMTRMLASVCK
jgi:hypothetical protein